MPSLFIGAEGRIRYAEFLARSGDGASAKRALDESADRVRLAPNHYQRAHAKWLDRAAQLRRSPEAPTD